MKNLFKDGERVLIVNTNDTELENQVCFVVGVSNTDWEYPTYYVAKEQMIPWYNGYTVIPITAACLIKF